MISQPECLAKIGYVFEWMVKVETKWTKLELAPRALNEGENYFHSLMATESLCQHKLPLFLY